MKKFFVIPLLFALFVIPLAMTGCGNDRNEPRVFINTDFFYWIENPPRMVDLETAFGWETNVRGNLVNQTSQSRVVSIRINIYGDFDETIVLGTVTIPINVVANQSVTVTRTVVVPFQPAPQVFSMTIVGMTPEL